MPDTPRPGTFKEVVAAEDPAERARIEKSEHFDDVTEAIRFTGGSPFSKTAMAPGSGASSISTWMAAATSQCSPALKPRGVHATISMRLNLDGYGPAETKGETPDSHSLADEMMIPRGKYIGRRLGAPPKDEPEHFMRCPACGGWIDCRDLGPGLRPRRPVPTSGTRPAAVIGHAPRDAPTGLGHGV